MSDASAQPRAGSFNAFLLVPILLFFALLIAAALRSPSLISSSGVGSAEIVVAPLILSTYALMAMALAGRRDDRFSIGPLIGFINVTLIQLNAAGIVTSPIAVFAYALATGVAYQLLFGLIVIFVRVQPIIVSLSGFLALSGINLVILPRPGGVAPDWMSSWGAGAVDLLAGAVHRRGGDGSLVDFFDDGLLRPCAADGIRRAGGLYQRRQDRNRPPWRARRRQACSPDSPRSHSRR